MIDVLKHCGFDLKELEGKHLVTEGADGALVGEPLETSCPMERVLDPKWEVILAVEANGTPLTSDHGAPVRLICPGYTGIRSCKWVKSLSIRPE